MIPQVDFMVRHMSQGMLIPNFNPCVISFLTQLLRRLKINYIEQKVNCDLQTVKPQDFCKQSHFEVLFII